MATNPKFISTLSNSITGSSGNNDTEHLQDGTDQLHSGILNALNIGTGLSFVIHGGDITQNAGGTNYTRFSISEIKYLRDGKITTASAVTNQEPTWVVNSANDWYGLVVIADGSESGESANTIKFRGTTALGTTTSKTASPKPGDIPVAVIQIAKGSAAKATDRKVQFLGIRKTSQSMSFFGSNFTEDLRINDDGTITKGGQTITFPATTGTVVTTGDTGTITAAMLGANSVDSSELVDGSIDTSHIADDQVTYAKIQNVSATNRILGRDSSGAGNIEEITPANLRTMINVEDGADVTDTTNVKAALNANLGSMTFGDANDTITIGGNLVVTGDTTYSNETIQITEDNKIAFRAGDGNSHEVILTADNPNADKTITLPAATGTVVLKDSTDTLTNKTFNVDGAGNSLTNIANANIKSGAAISATKIANGTISNTEFQYLNGVTSAIQTQIDSKSPTAGNTSLTTVGTISTGTWQGTPIADTYISSASTWNAKLSPTITDYTDIGTATTPAQDKLIIYDNSASVFKRVEVTDVLDKITSGNLVGSGKVFTTLPANGAEVNQNALNTISISGQDNFVANAKTDTVTFAAGSNVSITTTNSGDTITFTSTDTNTTYSAGTGISLGGTTFSVSAGNGLATTSSGLKIADPATLNQLNESTDATDDKILLWDESASSWKYMTIDDLQDSVDTNTQLSAEEVQDIVGAMFTSNTETRISASYQDGDGTIDLVVDDMTANTQLSQEQVEDFVNGLLVAGSNVTKTYDDAAGTLTIASTDTDTTYSAGNGMALSGTTFSLWDAESQTLFGQTNWNTADRFNIYDASADAWKVSNIAHLTNYMQANLTFTTNTDTQLTQEQVEDYVNGVIVAGSNITKTYDDAAGTLTIAATNTNTQLSNEQVQDIVGAMFSGNTETNITATYQDDDGTIDLVASGGDVVDDTSPQLGGDLDVQTHEIKTTSNNRDIVLRPDGTGAVIVSDEGESFPSSPTPNKGKLTVLHDGGTGPTLLLSDTDGDSNGGPNLNMFRGSASPADDDIIGQITFQGVNSNDELLGYGRVKAAIEDQSDGTEDGKLHLSVLKNGTHSDMLTISGEDNLVKVHGNFEVTGTQTVVDTVTMNAANAIVFEGATADANETTLTITDPTADRTITLPDSSGTVALTSQLSDTQYDFSVPGGTTALRLGGATASGNTNDDVTLSGGTNLTAVRTSETQITFNVDDAFLKNDGDDTTTGTITAAGLNLTAANDTPLVIQNTTNTGYAGIQFSDNSSNSYGQKGEFRFQHSDANSQGSGASFHFTTTEADLSIVGGKFIASDASASEPGFGFAGDVDTGMYQSAANTIQFVTAGTNRMQIASGGAVSINNDVSITKTLPSNDATTLSGAQAFVVDCIDDQSSSSGPGFAIRLEATNDHNGPNYTKTIIGDGGGMRVKNIFGNYGFSEWWLGGNADGNKPIMSLVAGGSTAAGEAQDGILTLYSSTTNWANNTYSPTNNTAKVRLDAGGDSYFTGGGLGIGTTGLDSLLHVSDAAEVTFTVTSSHATGAQIRLDATGTGGDEWRIVSGADNAGIGGGAFGLYNVDTTSYRWMVTSDGNVGIGTTSPSNKLHVEGSIAVAYALAHAGETGQNRIIFTTNTQTFQTAGTDRLTIASNGNVTVAGAFSAATKSFDIEHPTKEGKRLHHGSLEGPEHGVYIRGKNNSGTIHLPDYWKGLVDKDTITVQLTAIGKPQELYVREIKNNRVRVAAKTRGTHLNYFYFIQAERKDVEKMVVEY